MTRPLRIEFKGAVYHITSRGNARQAIFLDIYSTIQPKTQESCASFTRQIPSDSGE